jgi:hypothetical protein
MRPRWIRTYDGILYVLTLLLLLRELVLSISHGSVALHDPLLETSERPVDAALRDAEAQHHAVDWFLVRVAHEFEGDSSGPRDGDEAEAALAEDGLRLRVLVLRRCVEHRVVSASLLAARYEKGKVR